jgi:predicted dienelactone hydrolase
MAFLNRRSQICSRTAAGLRRFALCATLLISLAAWCQETPNAGPYHVLTIDHLVLHDAARNKDLPLKIYYPDAEGPFPVIVFSHGALASKDCYSELGKYWASFGYVSIHPSHDDSIADMGFQGTLQEAISDPVAWQNRPKDISFIIDSLPRLERLAPELRGKLDRKHIGVGGHSFGAYTSELIGGVTITVPGRRAPESFADKRVSAVLLLSPQGEGKMGLTADSWNHLHLPMLLMYGSRDYGAWGEPAVWRSEPYSKSPPGHKYKVEVLGGTHMGFAASSKSEAVLNLQFRCAKLETLAFWNAYLKNNREAAAYLSSDGLRSFSLDAANFASK